MKKTLTVLIVIVILVGGYLLLKSKVFNDAIKHIVTPENSGIKGRIETSSPSTADSGSYTIDRKNSSVKMKVAATTGSQVSNLDIKSGNLLIDKGNIVGGTLNLSTGELKKVFDVDVPGEMKLDIKAVVFDKLSSTEDNLVFRTDAELTMNGKTSPLSFKSQFIYQAGEYNIIGEASPDWKIWGVTSPIGKSISMDISINAVK